LKDDDLEEGDSLDEITEVGARQSLDEEYVEQKQYTTGRNVTLTRPPVSREKPQKVTDDPTPNNLAVHRWWIPLLKRGEEADLLREAKAGSKAAADKLFRHHHGAIIKIADSYFGPPFEVLMGAGALGFLEAIDRFGLRRNNGLWAYAVLHIRRRMLEAVTDWCRHGIAGETRVEKWVRLAAPKWPYSHAGRQLTPADVVEKVGCSREEAELAIQKRDALAHAPERYNAAEIGYSDEEDGDWPTENERVAEDKAVVECDRSGGKVTDEDWSNIVAGRARPSGLPGRGRNPQPPEPLKPISRARYSEDQRQAYLGSEAKAAQYHFGFNHLRSEKINPRRHGELARLVLHDMNPHRNGRDPRGGLIEHLANEVELRAKRRFVQVGRRQYAQEIAAKHPTAVEPLFVVTPTTYSVPINTAATASSSNEDTATNAKRRMTKLVLAVDNEEKNGTIKQHNAVLAGSRLYRDDRSHQYDVRQVNRATRQSSY
jgi:DNA-directed RNA polymerase sigma subunit (sigma70/sigma32)